MSEPADRSADATTAVRICPKCKEQVSEEDRFCQTCGRFVPRGPVSAKTIAWGTSAVVIPILILLAIAGYMVVPILGFLAEIALWAYLLSKGYLKQEVDSKSLLVGLVCALLVLGVVYIAIYFAVHGSWS